MGKHYALYVAVGGLNVVVSYALLLLLARNLSVADYALYGLVSHIAGLGLIALNFGHKEALFKFASQTNAAAIDLISASLRLWLCLAFCFGVLLWLVDVTLGIAALSFLCLYILIVASNVFRGRGLYAHDAVAVPLYRLLWLLFGAAILVLGNGLTLFWVFLGSAVAALVALRLVNGLKLLKDLFDSADAMRLPFKNSTLVNFFWLELATVAYLKVDLILLYLFGVGDGSLAGYFFAIQIFDAAVLALSPLAYLFFNRLNSASSERSLTRILLPFATAVAGVGGLIVVVWSVAGQIILDWVFPNYSESFQLTQYLLLALIPMGFSMLLMYALFSCHRERVYLYVCASGFVVCLVANVVLIPMAGAVGAAWARVVTEVLILVLLVAYFGLARLQRLPTRR